MPPRRISKSRDATPAASDSEEGPDAVASEGGKEEAAAGSKGKLRKAAADQHDTCPPKKRRRSSKTPEASNSAPAPADLDGEVSHHCLQLFSAVVVLRTGIALLDTSSSSSVLLSVIALCCLLLQNCTMQLTIVAAKAWEQQYSAVLSKHRVAVGPVF